ADAIARGGEGVDICLRHMPLLRQPAEAVEGRPAEDARVREPSRNVADLPDSRVRPVERASNFAAEGAEHVRRGPIDLASAADEMRGRFDHLAVRVELDLPRGGIPDPHRTCASIPPEVLDRPLPAGAPPIQVV